MRYDEHAFRQRLGGHYLDRSEAGEYVHRIPDRLQVRESRFRPLTVPMDQWRERMSTATNPTW